MKVWKGILTSFVIGIGLSVAPIAAYATCPGTIYVQDQADCHMYTRYVLVGTGGDGSVEICAYEDAGGSKHREDSCGGGFILE
jgi:hypothetical protein